MAGDPTVRVVVVHHRGIAKTISALRALLATEWTAGRLELVLVDNGSNDGIGTAVRAESDDVRIVRSPTNLGFGGGCNLGLEDLGDTSLVALVNDDVTVSPEWLRPLAASLRNDRSLGSASPKILFPGRFHEVVLESPTMIAGGGDRRWRGTHLSGARRDNVDVFNAVRPASGWWGPEPATHGEPGQWTRSRATLLVPAWTVHEPASFELRLSSATPRRVTIRSGSSSASIEVPTRPTWFPVTLGDDAAPVVSNVGTVLDADDYGSDRGHLEVDRGQYDRGEDVFAWCGAAVLLRREYLDDVGPFDERLFLYCEDLDLALRGRERGWRHRYVPESRVRHVHSASTALMSASRLTTLKERNHLIVAARHTTTRHSLGVVGRFIGATVGIARRDILGRLVRGERPTITSVRARARAFVGFLAATPGLIGERCRRRGRSTGAGRFN